MRMGLRYSSLSLVYLVTRAAIRPARKPPVESFRHIGQKVERRHRDVLNVVVLHKCKLLHPLVEYKGDAVVEECLPKHQKVESSVRLHILKDSQHCHRIDSCAKESSLFS